MIYFFLFIYVVLFCFSIERLVPYEFKRLELEVSLSKNERILLNVIKTIFSFLLVFGALLGMFYKLSIIHLVLSGAAVTLLSIELIVTSFADRRVGEFTVAPVFIGLGGQVLLCFIAFLVSPNFKLHFVSLGILFIALLIMFLLKAYSLADVLIYFTIGICVGTVFEINVVVPFCLETFFIAVILFAIANCKRIFKKAALKERYPATSFICVGFFISMFSYFLLIFRILSHSA